MAITLRDYQEDVFSQARNLVGAGARSVLIQMSTGAGKTAVGAQILQRATLKGAHTHLWVHRRELCRQSVLAMDKAGVECGIIAAGFMPKPNAPVQICSIQSLPRRVGKIKRPNLIIVDECHHAASASWASLIDYYKDAVVIGLSATPKRLDGSGLSKYFEKMVIGPSTADLIERGWLSRYRIFTPTVIDTSHLHTLGGEYNTKERAELMKSSTVAGDCVAHYIKHVNGKRALVFMWSVESSIEMAGKFNSMGIPAAHIDGDTKDVDRDRILKEFAAGTIKVLTNVDIVSEGLDIPGIEALFMLSPTKSLSRYLQMIGRALRPAEGKDFCWIFDHANNLVEHGFPDDPQEWTLEGKRKKKRDASDGPMSRTCPKCLETSRLNVRICPCGYKLVMDREVEVDEAVELTELDPAIARRERLIEQGMADGLAELEELGRRKGHRYPKLWAAHVYKAREQKKLAAARAKQLAAAATQTVASTRDAWEF